MPPLTSVAGPAGGGSAQQIGWVANGNLVIREEPSGSASVVGRLTPGTKVFPTGNKTKDGAWVEVQSGDTRGWVKKGSIHQG